MSGAANPCTGCKYYRPLSTCGKGENRACDYLLITGHARSLICPPGKRCTVREEGPQLPGELDADITGRPKGSLRDGRKGETRDPIPGYIRGKRQRGSR